MENMNFLTGGQPFRLDDLERIYDMTKESINKLATLPIYGGLKNVILQGCTRTINYGVSVDTYTYSSGYTILDGYGLVKFPAVTLTENTGDSGDHYIFICTRNESGGSVQFKDLTTKDIWPIQEAIVKKLTGSPTGTMVCEYTELYTLPQGLYTTIYPVLSVPMAAESSSRISGDLSLSTSLSSNISTEAGTRSSADTSIYNALSSSISSEAGTRGSADTSIYNALSTSISSNISTEAGTRSSVDSSIYSTLSSSISSEAGTRSSTDSSIYSALSTSISAEASTRLANMGPLHWVTFEIGDWNMNTTDTKVCGISDTIITACDKIRTYQVLIRPDNYIGNIQDLIAPQGIDYTNNGTIAIFKEDEIIPDSIVFQLIRKDAGTFDTTSYQNTSYNRGWVTVSYVI